MMLHRRPLPCVFALVLCWSLGLATWAQEMPASGDSAAVDRGVPVDSLAQAFAEAHALPSLVVGVVDTRGRQVWTYGAADSLGAPDAHTRYEIGSITKVFTALALGEMEAQGEIALDAPVAAFLPDSLDVAPSVTLGRLASHTAGLPRVPMNLMLRADPFDPYAAYTVADLYAALDGLAPDTTGAYAYSNLGAGLLGHTLARAADTTYAGVIQARVLDPLGLRETGVTIPDTARFAQPHAQPDLPTPPWTFTDAFAGAGALRASTADLLTFLVAHLAPPAALPPALAEAMAMAPQPRAEVPDQPFSVALGWHRWPLGEGDADPVAVWHNGGTGGTRSFLGYVPGTEPGGGVGVVVFANLNQDVTAFGLDLLRRLAER